ncbi:hypothetical protein [uncultured Microbacterium sp.]|uniref:hypothetical protein n=1 Tax=uncultured Microbacterium sp. TaxID=191216 RepID=UPI0025D994B1|nr:hypothetical protein [uncultured Microbacterium sp.]
MSLLSRWRSRRDARRSRRARFRFLRRKNCGDCGHPFLEHGADADQDAGDRACAECVYEIDHGFRTEPPCCRPIPADVLRGADAAAAMPRRSRRDDGGVRVTVASLGAPSPSTLREATAAMQWGIAAPRDVIAVAADLLATGMVAESLTALASLYPDATAPDVFDLSSRALVEAGGRPLDRDDEEVSILALRAACKGYQAGQIRLHVFFSWVHERVGHDGPDAAQPLVEFDDELDARKASDLRNGPDAARLVADFLTVTR